MPSVSCRYWTTTVPSPEKTRVSTLWNKVHVIYLIPLRVHAMRERNDLLYSRLGSCFLSADFFYLFIFLSFFVLDECPQSGDTKRVPVRDKNKAALLRRPQRFSGTTERGYFRVSTVHCTWNYLFSMGIFSSGVKKLPRKFQTTWEIIEKNVYLIWLHRIPTPEPPFSK